MEEKGLWSSLEGNLKFLDALKPYLATDAQVDILSVELRPADMLAGEDGLKLLKHLESASGIKLWGAAPELEGSRLNERPKSIKRTWMLDNKVKETYVTDQILNFEDALLDYAEFNKMQMQALRRQKMTSDAIAKK